MSFWKSRTSLEKVLLIITTIAVLFGTTYFIKSAWLQYKYYKEIEKDYKIAQDSIEALHVRVKKLSEKQETITRSIGKRSRSINDKLKQDEKTIDNSNPGDDELLDFIAKHEN